MPSMNLHIKFLGRPIKPVAFGLMIFVGVLGISALNGVSLLGAGTISFFMSIVMMVTSFSLFLGWYFSSQRIAELGLLATFWTLLSYDIFVLQSFGWGFLRAMFTLQPKTPSVWMSLGIVIIAGGSYILERADSFPAGKR
jgi:hypothetical protein